jgi:uncharacterized protein
VDLLLDYLRQVLPETGPDGAIIELAEDLEWHNQQSAFRLRGQQVYLRSTPDRISETIAYHTVGLLELADDDIKNLGADIDSQERLFLSDGYGTSAQQAARKYTN